MKIRIGTRGSELALWQANHTAELIGLENTEIIIIKTQGDKIQNVSFDKMEGKAFFTKEIEDALLGNEIDIAVHSYKDLPTENVEGLTVPCILPRGLFYDLLVINPTAYEVSDDLHVKKGSCIGTSSLRRASQLKKIDPSLEIKALRGNINTRLRKLEEGQYDAIVLAAAGVDRIGLNVSAYKLQKLKPGLFIPAPAQGALALQTRSNDNELILLLKTYHDNTTAQCTKAERSFMQYFGGGCHIPLGGYSTIDGNNILLEGVVTAVDGTREVRGSIEGTDPEEMGRKLALELKSQGADELI
jgi:hydroxymethylbilane synthase